MYFKGIFSFLILNLLTLATINGQVVSNNTYTGKCNDIYKYLEGQGKINNLYDCKTNNKGEVTELRVYPYCLTNKHLETLLSYKTIETLEFTRPIYYDRVDYDEIEAKLDCKYADVPTNYKSLSNLSNLKYLDLIGATEDINVIANIPKSIEVLKIGGNFPYYLTLTQKMVNILVNFTNLKSLTFYEVEIPEELDFKKFENFKNLTTLEIYFDEDTDSYYYITANILKNFKYLKRLALGVVMTDSETADVINNMTSLEELQLYIFNLSGDLNFSNNKFKNLTSLVVDCVQYPISTNYLNLPKLKTLSLEGCEIVNTSLNNKSTIANLKNLDYFYYSYGTDNFDINYFGDLPNIKEFHLVRTKLTSLPENIVNFKDLEVLNLHANSFESLPNSIGNLEKLKVLDIGYNSELTSIPEEIGNLKNLEELDFSGNKITHLPESLGNLVHLKSLIGFNNDIDNIPTTIGNLSQLEELDLHNNQITEIPNSIGNLKIKNLYLNDNNIEKIPEKFGNIKDLEYIDLSSNNIITIPSSIGNLVNLYELNLNNNNLTSLPDEIGNLKNLYYISLTDNKITEIPSSIGNLRNLTTFYLSNNLINSIPESIGNFDKLVHLYLNSNKLSSLPDEIGNLKNLQRLYLQNNELINLPESLENLVNLEVLYAKYNKIVNLPTNIGNLSKLKYLELDNNQIVEIPKSIGNLKIDYLWLSYNNIEKIPDEIGNMENLLHLMLDNNNIKDISNIPSSLGKLKGKFKIFLRNNQIDRIPDDIGKMKNVIGIYLSYNNITNLPSSLGDLKFLEALELDHNLIDDYLPESLNNLTSLERIDLSYNINIKGKTTTSPVKICIYSPPLEGNTYSLCESANATCNDKSGLLQQCKE